MDGSGQRWVHPCTPLTRPLASHPRQGAWEKPKIGSTATRPQVCHVQRAQLMASFQRFHSPWHSSPDWDQQLKPPVNIRMWTAMTPVYKGSHMNTSIASEGHLHTVMLGGICNSANCRHIHHYEICICIYIYIAGINRQKPLLWWPFCKPCLIDNLQLLNCYNSLRQM